MRKIALLTALLACLASAQAADPAPASGKAASSVPVAHPLLGTWSWTLPGKTCAETWQYRANGSRLGTSGEEVSKADYDISAQPSLLGFYRLVETVNSSNGKRDCSGDLHEAAGEPLTRFIQFSPKRDQFIVCKEESLKACFGPFRRTAD